MAEAKNGNGNTTAVVALSRKGNAKALSLLDNFQDVERWSTCVEQSELGGLSKAEAVVMTMDALMKGENPVQVIREYHVMKINGKKYLAMKGEAIQAKFQYYGGKLEILEHSEECVRLRGTAPDGTTLEKEWTIEMGLRAKGKKEFSESDVWHCYPENMLHWRCVTDLVRFVYPGIMQGIYLIDEIEDIATREAEVGEATSTPVSENEEAFEGEPMATDEQIAEIKKYGGLPTLRKFMDDKTVTGKTLPAKAAAAFLKFSNEKKAQADAAKPEKKPDPAETPKRPATIEDVDALGAHGLEAEMVLRKLEMPGNDKGQDHKIEAMRRAIETDMLGKNELKLEETES